MSDVPTSRATRPRVKQTHARKAPDQLARQQAEEREAELEDDDEEEEDEYGDTLRDAILAMLRDAYADAYFQRGIALDVLVKLIQDDPPEMRAETVLDTVRSLTQPVRRKARRGAFLV